MSLVIAVAVLVTATLLYTLFVRATDIPAAEPVSATRHLEERRAAIYENLRDLQFEYRVGKLSDADYQQTKLSLQKELAGVIGEIEHVVKATGTTPSAKAAPKGAVAGKIVAGQTTVGQTVTAALVSGPVKAAYTCPHCGAEFPLALKFCGECGKEMS
jgi:hypothetical protein